MVGRPQATKRLDQGGQILLRRGAAHEQREPGLHRQPQAGLEGKRIGKAGMKAVAIHPQSLGLEARDPHRLKPLQHIPAGHQHAIELTIKRLQIAPCRRLQQIPTPTAGKRQHIGVIERHHRNPQALPGLQRSPAGHAGIGGLDQVRTGVLQGCNPRQPAPGKAIALAERQRGSRDIADRPHTTRAPGWHHECVAPAGQGTESLSLDFQIAAHAPAVRRIEKGHVGKMHRASPLGTGGVAAGDRLAS